MHYGLVDTEVFHSKGTDLDEITIQEVQGTSDCVFIRRLKAAYCTICPLLCLFLYRLFASSVIQWYFAQSFLLSSAV